MWQRNYDGSPSLYLIPTPIGNMEDMTYRSVKILNEVEVIFSEDTRVTQNLLRYYDIKKKLISLHDHNEDLVKEKVLQYLNDGKDVGIVTDRGTPVISDPGYKTVKYVSDNGYRVICAGLDTNFRGEPFGSIGNILAIAEEVTKLTAICSCCGEVATRTQRIIDGKPAYYNDPIILVGEMESYEARCRNCHVVLTGDEKSNG